MQNKKTILYNEFDNEYTYIYKWSIANNLPVRWVVVHKTDTIQGYTFQRLKEAIAEFGPETPLVEIIEKLTSESGNLRARDIIFIWYEMNNSLDENGRLAQINRWFQLSSEGMIRTKAEYINIGIFNRDLANWKVEINKQFVEDNKEYERILSIQKELSNYKKVDISNVTIINIRYNILITSDLTENDNLYIFDKCKVSIYIPYIAYIDVSNGDMDTQTMSKLFKPTEDKFIVQTEDPVLDNTILFNILTKKEVSLNDIKFLDISDFVKAEFNLVKKVISFECDPRLLDLILERISDSLPLFSYNNYREEKVEARFDLFLPNIMGRRPILMSSFLDMILNNPTFNSYLVVNENTKAQAFKDVLTIQYRSLEFKSSVKKSDVIILMKLHSVEYEERIFTLENGASFAVPPESFYYTIRVNRSPNMVVLYDFVNIFRYLIGAYLQQRDGLDSFYKGIYPNLEERTKSLITRKVTKKRIKVLEDRDPSVFVSGYGTVCQAGHQPIIIELEDVDSWTSQQFFSEYYGIDMYRQAIPFMKIHPKWFFGCDDHKNAFPGVKENTLSNKDQYPYIPYCYETDQINSTESNNYKKYYLRGQSVDLSTRNQSTLKKITILKYHNLGSVTKDIESLVINNYEGEDIHLVRMGMPLNASSALFCICEALEDPNYLKSYNREEFVKELRTKLLTEINISCCYQENYEMNDEVIRSKVEDPTIFLDPLLYYRILEEYFKINIFTFWMNTKFESGIEVPRNKIFHASSFRSGRPNILIARHWGGDKTNMEYPQCELMVLTKGKNVISRTFDDKVGREVYQALISTHKNISISIQDNNTVGRDNLYNRLNMNELLSYEADSMFIDSNGKMRALYIDNGYGSEMMVIFPAASPENLKVRTDILSCDSKLAIDRFGYPEKKDIDSEGKLVGLWFKLFDLKEGIYVPVHGTDNLRLDLGSSNPLASTLEVSKLQNYHEIKYRASKIKEIIIFIFNIYRSRAPIEILRNDNLVIEFVNNYFARYEQEEENEDNAFYALDRLPSYLPSFRDVNEALIYFSKFVSFIYGKKIVFTSENLMINSVKFLRRYFNNTRGLVPESNRTLNLYFNDQDFDLDEYTLLFLSLSDMKRWVDSLKFGKHLSVIITRLRIERAVVMEPYLYKANNEQIYLIQNVYKGDLKKALYVCNKWLRKKRNPGFVKDKEIKTNIYLNYITNAITIDGFTVVLEKIVSSENDPMVELLVYNDPKKETGFYAAMLPLLAY